MQKNIIIVCMALLTGICRFSYAQQAHARFVRPAGVQCNGQQYWKLKTLSDNEGKQIIMPHAPVTTTITALRSIKRPTPTRPAIRWPIEKKVLTIHCRIDTSGYELDGDIHIVVKNLNNNTGMVVEIPNPDCENVKTSPFIEHIKKAYKTYTGLSAFNTRFTGIFEITGVPFFDKMHNGRGAAPAMIELHPVLKIRKL